jgi:hypothetical protein
MTIPRILSLITTVYVCQVIQDDIVKMKFRNVTAILVRMVLPVMTKWLVIHVNVNLVIQALIVR